MRPRFLVRQAESSEMLLHVLQVQTHSSLPFLCLKKDEPLATPSQQNSVTLFQIFSLRARFKFLICRIIHENNLRKNVGVDLTAP